MSLHRALVDKYGALFAEIGGNIRAHFLKNWGDNLLPERSCVHEALFENVGLFWRHTGLFCTNIRVPILLYLYVAPIFIYFGDI